MKNTLYTVQRVRKDDSFYGPIHGSTDSEIIACGIETDHNWYIKTNTFDGKITCKKCIKAIQKYNIS